MLRTFGQIALILFFTVPALAADEYTFEFAIGNAHPRGNFYNLATKGKGFRVSVFFRNNPCMQVSLRGCFSATSALAAFTSLICSPGGGSFPAFQ